MVFTVIFIFAGILLGAGVMFSPAWVTKQPRIALAGTLALALVIGGAVFWSYIFGWDTLVVDYMLFALVIGIFLGGTLSTGQTRAEKKGEILTDAEQGWTGPEDLLFFALIALIFIVPLLLWNVPFGDPLQAYMALSARLGHTFNSFAPFAPDVIYNFPPGFIAISAYISHQLNITVQVAQVGIGAVVAFMCIWLAYDFGSEMQDKRLGRAMAIAMLLGFGVFTTYIRSDFSALFGTLFALAFITFAYRYQRHGHIIDLIAAGLLLGAVALVHPTMIVITAAAYAAWLVLMWAGKPDTRPTPRRFLMLLIVIPLIALSAISPYLLRQLESQSSVFSVQVLTASLNFLTDFTGYYAWWIVIPALIGLVIGLRQRSQLALLVTGWLVAIPFALNGQLFVLIIPLTLAGGAGLLWLWENLAVSRIPQMAQNHLFGVVGVLIVVAIWGLSAFSTIPTAPLTADDLAALDWIKQNSDQNAAIVMPLDASVSTDALARAETWKTILTERSVKTIADAPTQPQAEEVYLPVLTGETLVTDALPDGVTADPVFESGEARVYRLAYSH